MPAGFRFWRATLGSAAMDSQSAYLRIGAVLGGLAVVIGAFGAHGLDAMMSDEMAEVFETGVKYHFYHALAILAIAAGSSSLWSSRLCLWACRAWTLGIIVFSGTLYALALTGNSWLGAITPIGGAAMIAGWVLLAIAAGSSWETG